MDIISEVGARGGSELDDRLVGLNSLPFVRVIIFFPKHVVVKSHWNNGRKGILDVVLETVVVELVTSNDVSDDNCVVVTVDLM